MGISRHNLKQIQLQTVEIFQYLKSDDVLVFRLNGNAVLLTMHVCGQDFLGSATEELLFLAQLFPLNFFV